MAGQAVRRAGSECLPALREEYEQWAADDHRTWETAGQARAELQRRGQAQPDGGPQARPDDEPPTTPGRWREFEADLDAMEPVIERERQAAIATSRPLAAAARLERQTHAHAERQDEALDGIEIEL